MNSPQKMLFNTSYSLGISVEMKQQSAFSKKFTYSMDEIVGNKLTRIIHNDVVTTHYSIRPAICARLFNKQMNCRP